MNRNSKSRFEKVMQRNVHQTTSNPLGLRSLNKNIKNLPSPPILQQQISDSKTIVQMDDDQEWKSQPQQYQKSFFKSKDDVNERTIYVADLLPTHTDADLSTIFYMVGAVKVTKQPGTHYGYVVFDTQENARIVLESKIDYKIRDHVIRVAVNSKPNEFDPNANLLIRNLEAYVNEQNLKDKFNEFGEIMSCKISRDKETGRSLCFGYLQFKTVESANKAIDKLNNTYWEEEFDPDWAYKTRKFYNKFNICNDEIKGKKMSITVFKKRGDYVHIKASKEGRESNLYVKNLGPDFGDADLKNLFKNFGNIKSAKIRRDKISGCPLGCGFVDFEDPDDAERAIEILNGLRLANFGDRQITVQMATCKSRRQRQKKQDEQDLVTNSSDSGKSSIINGDDGESITSEFDRTRTLSVSTPFTQASTPSLVSSPDFSESSDEFKRISPSQYFMITSPTSFDHHDYTNSAPSSMRSSPNAELANWNSFYQISDFYPQNKTFSQLQVTRFSLEKFEQNLQYKNGEYRYF